MRAKKLLTSRQIFRYAVPARTVTKSTDRIVSYEMSGGGCFAHVFSNPARTCGAECWLRRLGGEAGVTSSPVAGALGGRLSRLAGGDCA